MSEELMELEQIESAVAKMIEQLAVTTVCNNEVENTAEIYKGEQQKIIIIGGWPDGKTTEIFDRAGMKWTLMKSMKEERTRATSFVYNEQLFVFGGYNTKNKIETLRTNVGDISEEKWVDSPINWPGHLCWHCTEVYNDKVILIGGHNGSDVFNGIWQVQLQAPYKKQMLTQMPEPRYNHGTIIIEDKIFICGGRDALRQSGNDLDSVLIYDLSGNKFSHLAALPYPVAAMAVVKYKGNMIIIGGWNRDEKELNKVFIYNIRSGRSNFLPPMTTKRHGCTAAVINDEIFVMGGSDDKGKVQNTVEVFNFGLFSWRHLPAMNKSRYKATAVVI